MTPRLMPGSRLAQLPRSALLLLSASALVACGGGAQLECDPNAQMVTVNGTASCQCNPGYAGTGTVCVNVAVSLTGARWELPCLSDHSSLNCYVATAPFSLTETLGGTTGQSYLATLRFRGVIEQKGYSGGTASSSSPWYTGGTPSSSTWNIYSLQISSPAQTYYLNNGPDSSYYCIAIDYTETVQMDAHATVTLYADSVDGLEIKNLDDATPQVPIVVPGIAPAPDAYNGQFIQVDVVSVVPAS